VTDKPKETVQVGVSPKLKKKSKGKTGPLGKGLAVPTVGTVKEPAVIECPTCRGVVDPRRTTQALSRNARLLLFCSSGCLRQFLAAERAEQEKG
jgi:hypothetical protein